MLLAQPAVCGPIECGDHQHRTDCQRNKSLGLHAVAIGARRWLVEFGQSHNANRIERILRYADVLRGVRSSHPFAAQCVKHLLKQFALIDFVERKQLPGLSHLFQSARHARTILAALAVRESNRIQIVGDLLGEPQYSHVLRSARVQLGSQCGQIVDQVLALDVRMRAHKILQIQKALSIHFVLHFDVTNAVTKKKAFEINGFAKKN